MKKMAVIVRDNRHFPLITMYVLILVTMEFINKFGQKERYLRNVCDESQENEH